MSRSPSTKNGAEFIPWDGGECPVPLSAIVEFKCGDDRVEKMRASDLEWNHQGDFTDITAYRVVA